MKSLDGNGKRPPPLPPPGVRAGYVGFGGSGQKTGRRIKRREANAVHAPGHLGLCVLSGWRSTGPLGFSLGFQRSKS